MRTLIAVAHADDETLGCFSLMSAHHERIHILHATDSAPRDLKYAQRAGYSNRQDYKAARAAEFAAVLEAARIPAAQYHCLDIADLDTPLQTPQIRAAVVALKPDRIYTHAYEGGHPDHDAVAYALAGLPGLWEFPLYHFHRRVYTPQQFLAGEPAETVHLDSLQRQTKRAWLNQFHSQQRVISNFPLDAELFRPAPAYDFTKPPHEGELYYEHRGHIWTWPEWRKAISASERTSAANPSGLSGAKVL
jgi:LmbE family N-acetylglucosaminyl deacetylase